MIQLLCRRFSQNGNTVYKLCLTLSGGGSAVQIVPSLIMLVLLAVFEQITLTNMTFTGNSRVCARVLTRVCRVCVCVICMCIFVCVSAGSTPQTVCEGQRSTSGIGLPFPVGMRQDRSFAVPTVVAGWQAKRSKTLRPLPPSHSGNSGTADTGYVAQLLCMF